MPEANFSPSRIIKNTLTLYFRSIISMIIGLYSSRVLLKVLGVEDFGIYQAVGGMVVMFGFLNSTMSVSSQRFLNYEMGKNNTKGVLDVFCMSINIQILIASLMCVLCEIIGLYALYNFLSIPKERVDAAWWVLHFSIITLFISIISVPYNAIIIAKEDMKSFAYIDIIGSLLKLLAIIILVFIPFDYLIIYSALMVLIQLLIRFMYTYTCNHKYNEIKYHFYWNKELFLKMIGFSGWTTLSSVIYIIRGQGISVLYNSFYGVIISAAIGITNQVNNAITTLVNNFTTSFNPQITKSYAGNNWENCSRLHLSGPKFSFFLVSIISAPIFLNTDYILFLWLNKVPNYTAGFIWLILIEIMLRSLISTSNTVIRSTGRVKLFEILSCLIQLVFILLAYLCFVFTKEVYLPFICIVLSILFLSIYLIFHSCKILNIDPLKYFCDVYLRMILPYIIIMIPMYILIPKANSLNNLLLQSIFIVIILFIINYIFCFNRLEKEFLKKTINKFIRK